MNNGRDKIETIDYFVEDVEFMFISSVLGDPQPKSDSSISMLHNLVAPVMIGVASSGCLVKSTDVLSHTESQYSNSHGSNKRYVHMFQ